MTKMSELNQFPNGTAGNVKTGNLFTFIICRKVMSKIVPGVILIPLQIHHNLGF